MNITVYGDSILKGVLMENGRYSVDRTWEDKLTAEYGFSIRNRSRFGCTIDKAMPAIERDSEERYCESELAIIELGGNDCDYNWAEISADPQKGYDCKTPPETFSSLYREAVGLIRESGRTPVILTLPPIHSERYLRHICRHGLSQRNILHWLGDVEAISRWQEKYSLMAENIALEENTELIDLRGAFPSAAEDLEELLCDDGIHPSRAGQELIYRVFCTRAG